MSLESIQFTRELQPNFAALDVASILIIVIIGIGIVLLGYFQISYISGYTFKRHLLTSSMIIGCLVVVKLVSLLLQ